jgi:uncharacterized protein (UPF0147 family)
MKNMTIDNLDRLQECVNVIKKIIPDNGVDKNYPEYLEWDLREKLE